METLRSYVIKNLDGNMKNLVSCLCTWSTSTFPLVKSSKYIVPDQNVSHQFSIDVIHNDTMLLFFEILLLSGIEADRPWTPMSDITAAVRSEVVAESKSKYDQEVKRLRDLIKDLEGQVSSKNRLIRDNEKALVELESRLASHLNKASGFTLADLPAECTGNMVLDQP